MPNHIYRCDTCNYQESRWVQGFSTEELDKTYLCQHCLGTMMRRPCLTTFSFGIPKVRAGDWFKKTYGHEIGEKDEEKAEQQRNTEVMKKELEKQHGVKFDKGGQ